MEEMESKGKGGAPIGNQNAVGHGRPSNKGYSDEELMTLGDEMLAWMDKVDEEGREVVHLSEWYRKKKISRSQWNSITERGCFLDYYEQAVEWMGCKLLKNKNLPTPYGSRFLGIYFREVRSYEIKLSQEKIDYELTKRLSIEQIKGIPPNDSMLRELIESIRNGPEVKHLHEQIKELK